MAELILDKSFLDGAPRDVIAEVCNTYTTLFSESLFFEVMTTNAQSQVRCFSKLPDSPNAVVLIPNVGTLLRFEMENQEPCIPLFDRKIEGIYIFNRRLREGTYVPEGEVLDTLNAWHSQVAADTRDFLQRCQAIYQFFPELVGIEFRDFPAAVSEARRKIASDKNLVRTIYASFLDEEAPTNAPDPSWLDEGWAWFRWVQCQILAALRIFKKYQCRIPEPPTERVLLRAEHSMHDADYVLLGALAGAIATGDGEVEEDFLLVNPSGTVISSNQKRANPTLERDATENAAPLS